MKANVVTESVSRDNNVLFCCLVRSTTATTLTNTCNNFDKYIETAHIGYSENDYGQTLFSGGIVMDIMIDNGDIL